MKKYLVGIVLFSFVAGSNAWGVDVLPQKKERKQKSKEVVQQPKDTLKNDSKDRLKDLGEDTVVERPDELARFKGIGTFAEWVQRNTKYPPSVARGGRVFALFILGADGIPRDIQILESSDPLLSEAVVETIVKSRNLWLPAKKGKQPVAMKMQVHINFQSR